MQPSGYDYMREIMRFRAKLFFIIIFLAFFSVSIYSIYQFQDISWDSAVYLGMGKYIFSFGESGFFEPSRPIVWPILLGGLWKIGINPILAGKALQAIFGFGCVILTYLIAKNLFDEKIAAISSILLAFSPTFLAFSSDMLTEIPSTFLALTGIFFFLRRGYFFSGLLLGLAFMTRFLQIFAAASVFLAALAFCFSLRGKKSSESRLLEKVFKMIPGFLIITLPYIIFNWFRYNNPIYPFTLQAYMTKYTGLVFHQPWWFYFVNLLRENIMLSFALLGAFLLLRKRHHYNSGRFLLLMAFSIFFIFYILEPHKEMRFVITFLPYACIIASFGIASFIENIGRKRTALAASLLLLAVWAWQAIPQAIPSRQLYEFPAIQGYAEANENSMGDLWITNPAFIAWSDARAGELMYYPTFNHDKFLQLSSRLSQADTILFNSCDLYCEPYNNGCEQDKSELIAKMKSGFNMAYHHQEGECSSYIFKSFYS